MRDFLDRIYEEQAENILSDLLGIPLIKCSVCREYIQEGDMCEYCQKEVAQGYQVRSLAGRCRSGIDTHGTLFHALDFENEIALCGAKPGRRSVGWSAWGHGKDANCKRCLKKLEKR